MSSATPEKLVHIYVLVGEAQRGPFTIDQIRGLWNQAAITSDAYYWHEGLEDWGRLVDLMASGVDNAGKAIAHTKAAPSEALEQTEGSFTLVAPGEQKPSDSRSSSPPSGPKDLVEYTTRVEETTKQTKSARKRDRKELVAAHAKTARQPGVQPRRDAHKNSVSQHLAVDTLPKKHSATTENSGHLFGKDGKCRKCGCISAFRAWSGSVPCTQQAAEHFGSISKTVSPNLVATYKPPSIEWGLWILGISLVASIVCFVIAINQETGSTGAGFAVAGLLLFAVAMAALFSGGSSSSRGLDPRRVTAAASIYTAYKAHQIHEEIRRDSSDFGGG